jgi:hypothetical protein
VVLIAFLGLLIPTLLMGLSLPLLAKGVVNRIDTASERIGWLYGVNTFGAAAGAFVTGFLLIGTVGYEVTIYIAAVLNLLVGTGGLLLALRGPNNPADRVFPAARPVSGRIPVVVWQWCFLVFVSGYIAISLEIIWFRVVDILLYSTAYSFALVLGCFLFGDAVGIFIGTLAVKRMASPRRVFFWLQGAMTLYAIAALWVIVAVLQLPEIPKIVRPVMEHLFFNGFDHADGAPPTLLSIALPLGLGLFAVVPSAILLGMSFPITQKAIQNDPAAVGQRVGLVQLANILSNATGSFVTGLVTLHFLGTTGSRWQPEAAAGAS